MENEVKKIYYSIKEVSELIAESEPTLRYWEGEFQDVITPKRNEGGTRFYTEKDIQDVRLIQFLLRERRLTIEGAQKALKNNRSAAEKQSKLFEHLQNLRSELKNLEREMAQVQL
jgi:DNA-binding transcriptional MerR regulator